MAATDRKGAHLGAFFALDSQPRQSADSAKQG